MIEGLGTTAGLKMQVQDRGSLGFGTLQGMAENIMIRGASQPSLLGVYSTFRADTPRINLVINRANAQSKGINLDQLFKLLQSTTGTYYVNDITLFNNNFQVNLQAKSEFRKREGDIGHFYVKTQEGHMISLNTFCQIKEDAGPAMVVRYNMYPAAAVVGMPAPGASTGDALTVMAELAQKELPTQMGFEWSEIAYQQTSTQDTSTLFFGLSVVLVFLVLAAQYESWSLPLAVILIVPMCILCAVVGIAISGQDINIFSMIGLIVLVGLSSKNAILIVEFAKQKKEEGTPLFEATVEACRLRLRPIMMTSFAFILGVLPLILSSGAGAEMRHSLGIAVFSGMLGVTFFGLFLTPVFYFSLQWLVAHLLPGGSVPPAAPPAAPTH